MPCYRRIVALACLLALLLGCSGPAAPAEVVEATFARSLSEQMEPVDPTQAFAPEDTVYLSLKLEGNPKQGLITIRYLLDREELATVNLDLAEMRKEQGTLFVIGGNTFVGSTLTHDQPFPAGDGYRADVAIDGRQVGSYSFVIVAPEVLAEVAQATYAEELGDDMEPINPTQSFPPEGPVYLSVLLEGMPTKGVVGARFFYGDQEITSAEVDVAQWLSERGGQAADEDLYVGFTLRPDAPFPAGEEYRAELTVDGAPAGSYAFAIVAPAASGGAVSDLTSVKSAVIQIEAQGSFIDPQFGEMQNTAGRGSGFIIDPSGIAVTNNHVAAGAAFLKVWVGGESTPHNAKILGVSECSDLAVIDIDGEGYPYLEWYDQPIAVGLEVYAAGFPLGDPEYTLLQGIVSKERASGETNWASVDYVIEHTALTNPGNSGGPLVTKDGKVVAVHYSGRADTAQHYAISRDEALPIIEQLRAAQDVNSIGVNGQAVNDGQGLSGIWVASVQSGSPADQAGVKGGDIIVKLEGLVLATDGTLSDYCDVLRSRNPDDTMSIEVVRFATQEVLEGQLNGRVLEQKASFAQQVEQASGDGPGSGGAAAASYSAYKTVQDMTGSLVVEVPVEWGQLDGDKWVVDGEVLGAAISAAADLEAFRDTWGEPGIFIAASSLFGEDVDETAILDAYDFTDQCGERTRHTDYDDGLYTGQFDYYAGCGDAGSDLVVLAAVPEDRSFVIVLQLGLVSEADVEAADHVINSFRVVKELPTE